jgi:hypothetical protein
VEARGREAVPDNASSVSPADGNVSLAPEIPVVKFIAGLILAVSCFLERIVVPSFMRANCPLSHPN